MQFMSFRKAEKVLKKYIKTHLLHQSNNEKQSQFQTSLA